MSDCMEVDDGQNHRDHGSMSDEFDDKQIAQYIRSAATFIREVTDRLEALEREKNLLSTEIVKLQKAVERLQADAES